MGTLLSQGGWSASLRGYRRLGKHMGIHVAEIGFLSVIEEHIDPKTQTAMMTLDYLNGCLNVDRKTTLRIIKTLETMGLIEVERAPRVGRRNPPNVYSRNGLIEVCEHIQRNKLKSRQLTEGLSDLLDTLKRRGEKAVAAKTKETV